MRVIQRSTVSATAHTRMSAAKKANVLGMYRRMLRLGSSVRPEEKRVETVAEINAVSNLYLWLFVVSAFPAMAVLDGVTVGGRRQGVLGRLGKWVKWFCVFCGSACSMSWSCRGRR